jgi:hypothetical protein
MRYKDKISIGTALLALLAISAGEAAAQVCLGLPAAEGQISLQGEVSAGRSRPSVGGRLGLNFNTEYSLGFAVRRPEYEAGRGLMVAGQLGYEMEDYAPPICFVIGVQHERLPRAETTDSTLTMIPIGIGIGKRLGSARGLSMALFILPEYLYVAKPRPEGEYENFWDELGVRSHGRGTIGLLVATPFIFASGRVELSTLNNYAPTMTLGVGLIF